MSVYKLGEEELKRRGLSSLSYNAAQQRLHNGTIGQDDFDLICDMWIASPHTYSQPDSCKVLARRRLRQRFDELSICDITLVDKGYVDVSVEWRDRLFYITVTPDEFTPMLKQIVLDEFGLDEDEEWDD